MVVETGSERGARLAQVGDDERAEGAGEAPRGEHQSVDRPDEARAEIVGRKRAAWCRSRRPVAHEDHENDHGQGRGTGEGRQNPEENGLEEKHGEEGETAVR